jgi:membrane protease YdiL (CAAX protease family)
MMKTLITFGYMCLFALLGAVVALVLLLTAPGHLPLLRGAEVTVFTIMAALGLWVIALCFAALPGAWRPPAPQAPFGVWQGLWGMGGFMLAMIAGGMPYACLLAALTERNGQLPGAALNSPASLAATVIAGELIAALWLSWYLRRLGTAHLHAGEAAGIGWRPAPPRAYAEAAAGAVLLLAVVVALAKIFPPDLKAIESLPMSQLFSGPLPVVAVMLVVAMLLGPVLEEFAFRGIGFAGLAVRLGPLWASLLTSLAFVAAHAPEKLHYLPGFLDVGLLAAGACALRLRHHSLRPGMLLHVLYNSGGLLVAALVQ